MLSAFVTMALLGAVAGLAVARRPPVAADPPDTAVDRIDALLPQTQCRQCGYPGCRPYAVAIAAGQADIDLCLPGGAAARLALARLLGREVPRQDALSEDLPPPRVALIEEAACIGCTKCIQACPVDAIVGAAQRMHTVIAQECTGCALCIPPCPVDCISLVPDSLAAGLPSTAQG